ncbi:hypothetical protein HMPREF1608_00029 [Escherichia coli 908525]|nr:hypothetical protein HMPREF1602_01526 [Escherichia coli 907889]ESD80299.1 hypothetical protein HMPREF1608_00029 [Escherichia coli 908525]
MRHIQHSARSANAALTSHFNKSPNLMNFYLKSHDATDNRYLSDQRNWHLL